VNGCSGRVFRLPGGLVAVDDVHRTPGEVALGIHAIVRIDFGLAGGSGGSRGIGFRTFRRRQHGFQIVADRNRKDDHNNLSVRTAVLWTNDADSVYLNSRSALRGRPWGLLADQTINRGHQFSHSRQFGRVTNFRTRLPHSKGRNQQQSGKTVGRNSFHASILTQVRQMLRREYEGVPKR
jgi:hypothetical protein